MKGEAEVLVNGTWVPRSPTPGAIGRCPGCKSEMIAKCGKHIPHYWALKHQANSGSGSEGKTAWHKGWQAHFPGCVEQHVEKKIADVRIKEVVIEFQRSFLTDAERLAREQVYQNMLWVVDATRKSLGKRFAYGSRRDEPSDPPRTLNSGVTLDSGVTSDLIQPPFWTFVWGGTSKLFENWQHTSKPVFLDFGEVYGLWRLLSYCAFVRMGIAAQVSREDFLKAFGGRTESIPFGAITPYGRDTEPWRFSEAMLRRRMRNRKCVDSVGCTLHKMLARSHELFCPLSKKMDRSYQSGALFQYLTTR